MAKRTQEENNSQAAVTEMKGPLGLDDLIQQGARQIIQQAIEAELAALLERYSNVGIPAQRDRRFRTNVTEHSV